MTTLPTSRAPGSTRDPIIKDPSAAVRELRGFKDLKRIASLLHAVHHVGCDRDKSGNRQLHFDDYVLLILLFLFNPSIKSMRDL